MCYVTERHLTIDHKIDHWVISEVVGYGHIVGIDERVFPGIEYRIFYSGHTSPLFFEHYIDISGGRR